MCEFSSPPRLHFPSSTDPAIAGLPEPEATNSVKESYSRLIHLGWGVPAKRGSSESRVGWWTQDRRGWRWLSPRGVRWHGAQTAASASSLPARTGGAGLPPPAPPPSSAELPCGWREVRLLAAQPPASSFRPRKDGTVRRVGLTTRPLQND